MFAEAKIAPFRRYSRNVNYQSVLDLGSGPGTNAPLFQNRDYVGVDFNEKYTAFATEKFKGRFVTSCAIDFSKDCTEQFDLIIVNSLLHHLNDDETSTLMSHCANRIKQNGTIHIIDSVLPTHFSLKRTLAKLDRGKFVRPLSRWEELVFSHFKKCHLEFYTLNLFGLPAYDMFYFVGERHDH